MIRILLSLAALLPPAFSFAQTYNYEVIKRIDDCGAWVRRTDGGSKLLHYRDICADRRRSDTSTKANRPDTIELTTWTVSETVTYVNSYPLMMPNPPKSKEEQDPCNRYEPKSFKEILSFKSKIGMAKNQYDVAAKTFDDHYGGFNAAVKAFVIGDKAELSRVNNIKDFITLFHAKNIPKTNQGINNQAAAEKLMKEFHDANVKVYREKIDADPFFAKMNNPGNHPLFLELNNMDYKNCQKWRNAMKRDALVKFNQNCTPDASSCAPINDLKIMFRN